MTEPKSSTSIPGEMTSIDTGLIGYMAKKLPSGPKYNKRTGCIEGAAKKAGTYPFSLTVTTKAGSKVTQNFELVVTEEKLEEEEKPFGGVQLWENGPYWAECNVGATKPEEYGYYFWWGDTVGYKFGGGTLSELGDGVYRDVTWVSSAGRWMSSSPFDDCPTEYKDNSQLRSEGYIDRTGNLTAAHDAATAHLGAPWRMPTDAEFEALISTCITTWTTRNGVYGMLVTGKDAFASQSIFLPAAGYAWYNELSNVGSYGYCWSATPTSDNARRAWELVFGSDELGRSDGNRHRGRSVRPVRGFAK